jgi:hypothetical protein
MATHHGRPMLTVLGGLAEFKLKTDRWGVYDER